MKNLILGFLCLLATQVNYAQDLEGCKDHPMFNRMPNYLITNCSKNYGLADLAMLDGETKSIEGYKTEVEYELNSESGVEPYSFYQVVKNYENALAKYGVKRIYLASQYATLFLKTGNKSIWIGIEASSDVAPTYTLIILEIEEMQQDIQASGILDELNKNGHIALYINFETGKSDIKPESDKIIDQIVEMLKANPEINVSVEGHTDNVGSPASNLTLSSNRAISVVSALTSKGVAKSRLSAKGQGQTKPIADNSTEDGKALNRRVEIVKL